MKLRERLSALRNLNIASKKDFIKIPIGYILILLFAVSPILVAMIAGGVGQLLGCRVHEGGTSKCVVFGIPIGDVLGMFFSLGWLALKTLPIGVLLLLLWSLKSYRKVRLYLKQ